MKEAKMIIRVSEYSELHDKLIRAEDKIMRLEKENLDLRLQLQQAHDYIQALPPVRIALDPSAIEPEHIDPSRYAPELPTGQPAYWFNEHTGPYKADDTLAERACRWSHGPFTSWNEANDAWKAYIKRQRENGQP